MGYLCLWELGWSVGATGLCHLWKQMEWSQKATVSVKDLEEHPAPQIPADQSAHELSLDVSMHF